LPCEAPDWLAPETLEEALALRAEREDATVVAGGTFVGILVNQRLLAPTAFLSLGGIPASTGSRAGRSFGSGRWRRTAP